MRDVSERKVRGKVELLAGRDLEIDAKVAADADQVVFRIDVAHHVAGHAPRFQFVLVEGFDDSPYVMMTYNPPYYDRLIRGAGLEKAKDLLAYRVDPRFENPTEMAALLRKYGDRLVVRTMNRSDMKNELESLRDIFNDAWAENWGFVPFTEAEFRPVICPAP